MRAFIALFLALVPLSYAWTAPRLSSRSPLSKAGRIWSAPVHQALGTLAPGKGLPPALFDLHPEDWSSQLSLEPLYDAVAAEAGAPAAFEEAASQEEILVRAVGRVREAAGALIQEELKRLDGQSSGRFEAAGALIRQAALYGPYLSQDELREIDGAIQEATRHFEDGDEGQVQAANAIRRLRGAARILGAGVAQDSIFETLADPARAPALQAPVAVPERWSMSGWAKRRLQRAVDTVAPRSRFGSGVKADFLVDQHAPVYDLAWSQRVRLQKERPDRPSAQVHAFETALEALSRKLPVLFGRMRYAAARPNLEDIGEAEALVEAVLDAVSTLNVLSVPHRMTAGVVPLVNGARELAHAAAENLGRSGLMAVKELPDGEARLRRYTRRGGQAFGELDGVSDRILERVRVSLASLLRRLAEKEDLVLQELDPQAFRWEPSRGRAHLAQGEEGLARFFIRPQEGHHSGLAGRDSQAVERYAEEASLALTYGAFDATLDAAERVGRINGARLLEAGLTEGNYTLVEEHLVEFGEGRGVLQLAGGYMLEKSRLTRRELRDARLAFQPTVQAAGDIMKSERAREHFPKLLLQVNPDWEPGQEEEPALIWESEDGAQGLAEYLQASGEPGERLRRAEGLLEQFQQIQEDLIAAANPAAVSPGLGMFYWDVREKNFWVDGEGRLRLWLRAPLIPVKTGSESQGLDFSIREFERLVLAIAEPGNVSERIQAARERGSRLLAALARLSVMDRLRGIVSRWLGERIGRWTGVGIGVLVILLSIPLGILPIPLGGVTFLFGVGILSKELIWVNRMAFRIRPLVVAIMGWLTRNFGWVAALFWIVTWPAWRPIKWFRERGQRKSP